MNYYEHHLGDYAEATGHLSFVEDAAYSRLMRKAYATEKPLPADTKAVQRLIGARTKEERQAVEAVLAEFWTLTADGWRNARCDAEIARYQDKQRKAKASAEARWSHTGRNANAPPDAMRTHSEGNALQTPDTRHQTPEEKDTRTATATDAGRVCKALKAAGVSGVNPGHPDLLALLAAGATDAEFAGAGEAAVRKGKGFAYALGTLKRQREEAAALALHKGPLPRKSDTLMAGNIAAAQRFLTETPQ